MNCKAFKTPWSSFSRIQEFPDSTGHETLLFVEILQGSVFQHIFATFLVAILEISSSPQREARRIPLMWNPGIYMRLNKPWIYRWLLGQNQLLGFICWPSTWFCLCCLLDLTSWAGVSSVLTERIFFKCHLFVFPLRHAKI